MYKNPPETHRQLEWFRTIGCPITTGKIKL